MIPTRLALLAAATLAATLAAGCQSAYDVRTIDPLEISAFLETTAAQPADPAAELAQLDAMGGDQAAGRAAEIAFVQAARLEAGAPQGAASWYLLAAARAADALALSPLDGGPRLTPHQAQWLQLYNLATDRYLLMVHEVLGQPMVGHVRGSPRETFRVEVGHGGGLYDPREVDQVLSATGRLIEGFTTHHRRSGVGAPCIVFRENRHLRPIERYYPPEGITRAATAVLHFGAVGDDGLRQVTLAFHDPDRHAAIPFAGGRAPLAADFTAPYGYLLSRAHLKRLGRLGLLDPESSEHHRGFFMLDDYDPQKIPVLMVHGLWSSPLAWAGLTNELLGTAELRARFQVWHYFYPTGLPYLYSASLMRRELEALRRELDPEGDDPATGAMVAIGHSMGGLLVKTLAADSGDTLWDAIFTVPPEGLRLPTEDVERLVDMFTFSPRPYVRRVVFISTPHRGSAFAGNPVGQLAAALSTLPQELKSLLQRAAYDNPGAATPEMDPILRRGGATSVRALRPGFPLLTPFASIPVDPRVPFHTILGDEKEGGPVSDGVVAYDSGHLDGAASERIVPSGHGAYDHPETLEEIRRILLLHLAQRIAKAR